MNHPRIGLCRRPPPSREQLLIEFFSIGCRQPRIPHTQPTASRTEYIPVKHAPDLPSPPQSHLGTASTSQAVTQRHRPHLGQRILTRPLLAHPMNAQHHGGGNACPTAASVAVGAPSAA